MFFAHLTSRKAQRVKQTASLAFSLFFLLHSLTAFFVPDASELAPEKGNSPIGSELDAHVSVQLSKRYQLGLKLADFHSDSLSNFDDTNKSWLWVTASF